MKAVLISIQPKWCELIANGKKTVEVRKTKPKLETPFKVYIYQTKESKRRFLDHRFNSQFSGRSNYTEMGKVIGEFVCDCITPLYNVCYDEWERLLGGLHRIEKELVGQACLTEKELHSYANGKQCYGWHISDLVIYDKPKELSEFKSAATYGRKLRTKFFGKDPCCVNDYRLTRPPQSWCYVERSDNNGE